MYTKKLRVWIERYHMDGAELCYYKKLDEKCPQTQEVGLNNLEIGRFSKLTIETLQERLKGPDILSIRTYIKLIAEFYKRRESDYRKHIQMIGFRDIQIIDNKLHIYCSRPGILLGKRGEHYIELEKFLDIKIELQEVALPEVEQMILEAL